MIDRDTPGGILLELKKRKGVNMCSPALCRQCNRVTWSGCGAHVDEVMADVPEQQRCTCR